MWDTSDPTSMVAFTFTMPCHLNRLASAPFNSFRSAKFGWARFLTTSACDAWQRSMPNAELLRRAGKNSGPILSGLWTKVNDISGQCRRPLCFPMTHRLAYLAFLALTIILSVISPIHKICALYGIFSTYFCAINDRKLR